MLHSFPTRRSSDLSFGPLQELGNIINIYRETEASLNIYEEILRIPKEPRAVNPLPDTGHRRKRPGQAPYFPDSVELAHTIS